MFNSKEGVQPEYKIFSIKGELVQSGLLDNSVVLGEGLSSGVYELKLIEADKVSSLKLIKQ